MAPFKYNIKPFGEKAILVQFNETVTRELQAYITAVYKKFQQMPRAGIVSLIPAYDSITLIFHPEMTNYSAVSILVESVLGHEVSIDLQEKKTFKLPVCYELGLDTEEVLKTKGLALDDLIELHSEPRYLVHFLGFVPGFMYLGGLNERLFIDRKQEPRLKIPAGAVALGGDQTGVYPLETPGGWQVIGLTPSLIYDKDEGSPIRMGDSVSFYAISETEYNSLNENPVLITEA